MNISGVDLNLFPVLAAVLEEGSATRAAARLHVTQSAVSNALARLRALTGDPLFVRTARGLVPTPLASQMGPMVTGALDQLGQVLEATSTFDPSSTERRFTVCCSDHEEMVLMPRLVELMAQRMPRASLRVVTVQSMMLNNSLATGEVDALIGIPPQLPPGCLAEELFAVEGLCVVRRGHPFRKRRMAPADLTRWPHIAVAVVVEPRGLKEALARQGLTVRNALVVPHFTVGAFAVLRTDYLLPFPRIMAGLLAQHLPLRLIEVDGVDLPPLVVSLVWHARTDADPAGRLFRDLVRKAAGDLVATPGR